MFDFEALSDCEDTDLKLFDPPGPAAATVTAATKCNCVVERRTKNRLVPRRLPRNPSLGRPWKILCVGDSLTADGYPRYLEELLGAQRAQVKDFGVRGMGVLHQGGYRRLARLGPELAKNSPDAIVTILGVNDTRAYVWRADAFLKEYIVLLSTLLGLGINNDADQAPPLGRLVLVGLPPKMRGGGGAWGLNADLTNGPLPQAVQEAATTMKVPVFDPREALDSGRFYDNDGVHLSVDGHRQLAKVVCDALLSAASTAGWFSVAS